MMKNPMVKKAFMAGMAGTIVMTVFSYLSHYFQLPRVAFHEMISNFFNMGTPVGWTIYFVLGIGLAYVYGAFFKPILPTHSWGKGLMYAFILWGALEMVLMPVLGMGFFAGSMTVAAAALVGIGLYGATVGYLYEH